MSTLKTHAMAEVVELEASTAIASRDIRSDKRSDTRLKMLSAVCRRMMATIEVNVNLNEEEPGPARPAFLGPLTETLDNPKVQ